MNRPMRSMSVAAALVAAGAAYALAATPGEVESARETPYRGVVARLPYIGTLSWRCDDEQRFFTKLTLPTPGASLTVSVSSDGETIWRGRPVHPLPPPRHGSAGPFRARKSQTWTIRYHHKPATLKVVARLRFAAPRPGVECLVSRAVLDTRRTPH